MTQIIKVQKGTKDILPTDVSVWQSLEEKALELFTKYGYKEIRTPIFEATELFSRGVGDTTDIVNKEMYTFEKSERSLTLRPENTAGVVRSFIENGMHRLPAPVKLWYKGPMFRYERPQAGRQRQFHQVGVECFGSSEPVADAEVIILATEYLKSIGLNDLIVEINSLGCPKCREDYKKRIKEVLKPEFDNLCDDCKARYEKNPLRLLDCKVDSCKEIFEKPEIKAVINSDFICDECREHYEKVKEYLNAVNVKFVENKLLVRGLDYYTRTVFEIKSNNLGAQNAVCGGGRYDNLVKQLGGEDTPAVGWAMGMERLCYLVESPPEKKSDIFVVSNYPEQAFELTQKLRAAGYVAEFDFANKKFNKQLEKAVKSANYAVFLGEDELKNNNLTVKNLNTSVQKTLSYNDLQNIKNI